MEKMDEGAKEEKDVMVVLHWAEEAKTFQRSCSSCQGQRMRPLDQAASSEKLKEVWEADRMAMLICASLPVLLRSPTEVLLRDLLHHSQQRQMSHP
jgi:hypothetical protein